MTNEDKEFEQLVGPMALDKAEQMLTRAIYRYVASVSAMKAMQHPDLKAAMRMGRKMLIEMVEELAGIDTLSATMSIENMILAARENLRKTS